LRSLVEVWLRWSPAGSRFKPFRHELAYLLVLGHPGMAAQVCLCLAHACQRPCCLARRQCTMRTRVLHWRCAALSCSAPLRGRTLLPLLSHPNKPRPRRRRCRVAAIHSLFFHREMELSLIGLQNAGKSSLVNVLTTGSFHEDMIPTVRPGLGLGGCSWGSRERRGACC
jgi:hypothetical protein